MTPNDFATAIIAYCFATGGSVAFWGRTPKHNKTVGGVENSAHQLWIAADVVYDVPLSESHRRSLASRLGLVLVVEDDHDHLQGG